MKPKNSNIASIIVAVIAIILILGGVFVLNQNANRSRNQGNDVATESSSSEEESSSEESSLSSSESSESSVSSSEDESVDPDQSTSSSNSSVSPRSSSSSLASSAPSTSSSVSSLGQSVALIRVNSYDAATKRYQIEVIDTGYLNGRLWRKGAKFAIAPTVTLEQGGQYQVSGISETSAGRVSYGNIVKA